VILCLSSRQGPHNDVVGRIRPAGLVFDTCALDCHHKQKINIIPCCCLRSTSSQTPSVINPCVTLLGVLISYDIIFISDPSRSTSSPAERCPPIRAHHRVPPLHTQTTWPPLSWPTQGCSPGDNTGYLQVNIFRSKHRRVELYSSWSWSSWSLHPEGTGCVQNIVVQPFEKCNVDGNQSEEEAPPLYSEKKNAWKSQTV